MILTIRNSVFAVISFALLLSTACAPSAPELPSDTSPAAIAERITGSGGSAFLSEITTYNWPDHGRRAGELLAWIPRDSGSLDQATAARAGTTAHALAVFLADHYAEVKDSGKTNPALIQSYAGALVPYLGAVVGDQKGVSSFEPLDGLDTDMPRSATVFAAIGSDPSANSTFTEAANQRGLALEREFADAVAADPSSASSAAQHERLARAARLLGLVAAGTRLAGTAPPDSSSSHAETAVAYAVASRMVQGRDPHFSAEYFTPQGVLKAPNQIDAAQWSLYDTQLSNYLATYPAISKAIDRFASRYRSIAGS